MMPSLRLLASRRSSTPQSLCGRARPPITAFTCRQGPGPRPACVWEDAGRAAQAAPTRTLRAGLAPAARRLAAATCPRVPSPGRGSPPQRAGEGARPPPHGSAAPRTPIFHQPAPGDVAARPRRPWPSARLARPSGSGASKRWRLASVRQVPASPHSQAPACQSSARPDAAELPPLSPAQAHPDAGACRPGGPAR